MNDFSHCVFKRYYILKTEGITIIERKKDINTEEVFEVGEFLNYDT